MATLDQRVTDLETAVADVQAEILKRATSDEVLSLEKARDLQKDAQDTTNTSITDRVGKLERNIAVFQRMVIDFFKRDANGNLPEDVVFSSGKGPVVRSTNNTKYRIKTSDAGALSTETVT